MATHERGRRHAHGVLLGQAALRAPAPPLDGMFGVGPPAAEALAAAPRHRRESRPSGKSRGEAGAQHHHARWRVHKGREEERRKKRCGRKRVLPEEAFRTTDFY
eukprot:scaffold1376_cov257-Pinguiococcus_pyrenoidosus.AAC.21